MALLEIRTYPDPVLTKKAEEVKEISAELKDLFSRMIETMEAKEGVGLAAPQIGESKKVIVVRTEKGPVVFVNPRIIKKSRETERAEEGCLSLPGIWLEIKRAKEIELEAVDINGKKVQIKAEGLLARVFQHEIDHLEGKLIIDRLNFFEKLKLKKQLRAL
jgi:peptide deformylase